MPWRCWIYYTTIQSSERDTDSLITWPSVVGSSVDDIDLFPRAPANISPEEDIRARLEAKTKHISHAQCPYL